MYSLKKRFPIYSKAIGLYPKKYRKEYGQQILQTTADMLDNARSRRAKVVIWSRLAFDLPANITKQQFNHSLDIYTKNLPPRIKTSGIVSSLLLLPFFVALIANGLDKVVNNHTLYSSWLWKTPLIAIWVLYLPLAAFLIAATAYLYNLTKYKKTPFLKRVFDVQHSWPILLPAIVGFGILFILVFHDSAQCWVQTPSHFASHINQTWQCTKTNSVSIPTVLKKAFGF